MGIKEDIFASRNQPVELEILYRANPQEFVEAFPQVFTQDPDSLVLQGWQKRLFAPEKKRPEIKTVIINSVLILILTFLAGIWMDLPHYFHEINPDYFFNQFFVFEFLSLLSVYLLIIKRRSIQYSIPILILFTALLLFVVFGVKNLDAEIQNLFLVDGMPIFLWALTGIAYCGSGWLKKSSWVEFITFTGEMLVFSFALFGLISIAISMLPNIFFMGDVVERMVEYLPYSAPFISAFLIEKIIVSPKKLSPLLARGIAPLFFLVAFGLIFPMSNVGSRSSSDSFFSTFYITYIHLTVMALTIFATSQAPTLKMEAFTRYANLFCAIVAFFFIGVSLVCGLSRASHVFFNPKQLAFLSLMLLFSIQLAGLIYFCIRNTTPNKKYEATALWNGGFAPFYLLWATAMCFVFPLIYG